MESLNVILNHSIMLVLYAPQQIKDFGIEL